MGDVSLEKLYLKSIEDETQLLDLEKLGGKKSVEFYKDTEVSYYLLKSALLSGYSIDEIKDTYDKYYKDKEIESIVTFDELMSISIAMRVKY